MAYVCFLVGCPAANNALLANTTTTHGNGAAQVLMNVVSDEAGKEVLRRSDLDGVTKVLGTSFVCWWC